jgi:succinyl-CoA synthetase alpha subunit
MQGNWQKNGVGDFKYYVGISSLTQVASRDDRVCVLNILGGESSEVTPVSHAYSGGNVVCGTAPGKGGACSRPSIGNIPVYNSVRDALVPATASTAVWSTRRLRPRATAWPNCPV